MFRDGFSDATSTWFESTFSAPTRVQREGWPAIQSGEHALLLAPTGSGKTLAAFLAALDGLSALPVDAPPGVRVLYISPLKALVYDIERNLRAPLEGIANTAARIGDTLRPIRVDIRTGDTPQRDRRQQLKDPAEVLVTTPESLFLLLGSQARETLRTVNTVIVDEIHVLAGGKRGSHLALSLERLCALTADEPQRIGLSATQRPLEIIARFLGGDREVQIIDTSEPPRIELQITVPVEDMDRPITKHPGDTGAGTLEKGLWPTIYPEILDLIRSHRSTIVFTNSRILCERLAQRLNELAGEDLVRAHHGSISHSQRAATEDQLKRGELPAIVATSSLELGIDMGAVDLVILVESPGAVSRGLQRIGRAGHGVGEVSVGRIFPKFKGDLVECAVVAERMMRGEIERTAVPRNCLDVLAQQVVATVAMADREVGELMALFRRAFPYAQLSDALFFSVLDMLAGRYPSDAFADLAPRITWDRSTDTLRARRGSRSLALLNAGTIPDRGLYGVFLAGESGPRLGELDEEMVYESRTGDTIILGASTWRIEKITRDQVIVSPAPGQPGRLPFWHGDRPGRPVDLGRAIGAFARKVAALPPDSAAEQVAELSPVGPRAARNLVAYLHEQRAFTELVPSDQTLVVERFRDEIGDWRVCILSPFGTRVHAPWALAIEAIFSANMGYDVQTLWTDDGISLRFADVDDLPDLSALFIEPDAIEDLVVEQLGRSALFAARFRENAGRSLLLPRRSFKGRKPLWQQRLKAQQLQSIAAGFPGFPVVLETYRECLQDVFDLPALKQILSAVRSREIVVHEVETPRPSPFARSLVFANIAAFMYEADVPQAERRVAALTLDRDLLSELLGHEQLRELLDAGAVTEVEAELQWLAPDRKARDADALHDLLRRLGDLSEPELQLRAERAIEPWLQQLGDQRRALPVCIAGQSRWIAAEDAARFRDALGVPLPPGLPAAHLEPFPHPVESLIRRWARTHGPFTPGPVAARFGLPVGVVETVLRGLEASGALFYGAITPGTTGLEWCDPEALRRLRRRSLAKLRGAVAPVEAAVYARFLMSWHGIGKARAGIGRLREVIEQLEGVALPFSALESHILPARVQGYQPGQLDQLGMTGEIVWLGRGALGSKDGRVALYWRDRVQLFVSQPEIPDGLFDPDSAEGPLRQRMWEHLGSRGASFLAEIHSSCGGENVAETTRALWDLVWAGLITNDTFLPLRSLASRTRRSSAKRSRARTTGGRWSAVKALLGSEPSPTERAHALAVLLLQRHGIASSSVAKADGFEGGFASVYPILRAMEEAGKVRRGWFIEGLGGAQFALPGAVDRLRSHRDRSTEAVVLSAVDPASPWGATLPWPERADPQPRRDASAIVVLVGGLPVFWLGPGGRSLLCFDPTPRTVQQAVDAIRSHRAGRRLRIDRIDGTAALDSPLLAQFCEAGFAVDYKALLLA